MNINFNYLDDLKEIDLSFIRTTSNWNFKNCDKRFGFNYPGRIPGQIYINLFYFFTEKDDNILDAFCGSGTGLDVGKLMERNVIGLDLNPAIKDIKQFDLILDHNPFKKEVFQLIFLDPPYFNMNRGKYTMEKTDLSNLDLKKFLDAIELIIKKFFKSLKYSGYLALIISNKREKNNELIDLGFLCENLISKYLKLMQKISVPYENTSFHTKEWRERCLKKKFILIGTRDLLIFQKVRNYTNRNL